LKEKKEEEEVESDRCSGSSYREEVIHSFRSRKAPYLLLDLKALVTPVVRTPLVLI